MGNESFKKVHRVLIDVEARPLLAIGDNAHSHIFTAL